MKIVKAGAGPKLAGGRMIVDLDALAANWRDLADRSAPARCAAVVKANAYGLDTAHVVPALLRAGCKRFFVALPEEGVAVRRLAREAEVFVLNGVYEQSAATLIEANLIPVLNSIEQIDVWAGFCRKRGIRSVCAISIDTGMNRLGLTAGEAMAFQERNAAEHLVTPIVVMSHLACGDEPDHPLNRQQLKVFQQVATYFEGTETSLANSAGVFLGPDYAFDLTRPGIAIYGGRAIGPGPSEMRPVVTLDARIVQFREARNGETISYGAAETLERDTRIAVVSVGYADGYPRSGSGAGVPMRDTVQKGLTGWIGGVAVPVLGRITMDLTLFDVTDVRNDALRDGWIELIGPNIPLDDAAAAAGTVSYELLTSLGSRYERRYIRG